MYCIPFQFHFLSIYVNDALSSSFFFFFFFFNSKRTLWRNILSSCIQYFSCLAEDSIFHMFLLLFFKFEGRVGFFLFLFLFLNFGEADYWTFVSVNLIPSEHKHTHKI